MTDVAPSVSGETAAAPPFIVNRLTDVAGAEILGVDLSRPLAPGVAEAIVDAFNEHHVLAFRDQRLSDAEQHAFTLNFGEIE